MTVLSEVLRHINPIPYQKKTLNAVQQHKQPPELHTDPSASAAPLATVEDRKSQEHEWIYSPAQCQPFWINNHITHAGAEIPQNSR